MSLSSKEVSLDYTLRIQRVFQFIDTNLQSSLSLQRVSEVAFFSPYHFHRIFKFITGETLNGYITRCRLEKSALDLLHTAWSVAEIAAAWGFNDPSSFTRAFKKFYGTNPSSFRKQHPYKFSKIRQIKSKNGEAYPSYEKYICSMNHLKEWIQMNAEIEIKEIPKMELAYVSNTGAQNLGIAYQKLMRWARPRGLMNEQTKMLTIYYDSFKVTEASKVRMRACILLHEAETTEGEVASMTLEGGRCIVGSFVIGVHEFEKSWTGLFLWMNQNGCKKANRPPFEIYHNNFNEHPEKKAYVDFYIPIE